MRILLSSASKKELLLLLKIKYKCNSIGDLSKRLHIPKKTLQGWFYLKKRYIPKNFVIGKFTNKPWVIDEQDDRWGQSKGGIASYKATIKKFGIDEFKRRQALGGRNAAKTKEKREMDKFKVDLCNHRFLEFYGILLGDGWLSNFVSKGKRFWIIGVSLNLTQEKDFLEYFRSIIEQLFQRKGTIRVRAENNSIGFVFHHKILVNYLNQKLNFPIGKKNGLAISKLVYKLGFNKIKYVIRGYSILTVLFI